MCSNNLICDILIYIDNNINSKITIEDLENRFFYNRYYIMKLFKKEIGLTIVEYINSIRVYNSIQLIRSSHDSLLNIAIKCGFYSLEYFSETFKQITNANPTIFRNYFNNNKYIDEEQIDTIRSSIINLSEINNIKNKYLSRKKPSVNPIKKLSIFK